ncbi:NTP transferase domain-containing protein [Elusimicrobiota bacterium]
MKAIILAAGEGKRLKKYTGDTPKGMLEFAGKSIIERQIDTFRNEGIEKIIIVRGFAYDKINFPGVTYYENPDYDSTNMLVSLFCAEAELEGDIIVSYADILFEERVLKGLIRSENDINVTIDTSWQEYWTARYGKVDHDTESLKVEDKRIVALGKPDVSVSEIDGRYVGLLRFSAKGTGQLRDIWLAAKEKYWDIPWQISGKPLKNAFMTDMINAMIEKGYEVNAYFTRNGWLEFDTDDDYEKMLELYNRGMLDKFIKIEN